MFFRPARPIILAALLAGPAAAPAFAEVVAVVSATSPVAGLNKSQVADIFLGKVTRLPGGGEAVPIDQVEGLPVRDEFYVRFTDKTAAQVKAYWSKIIFTGRGKPPKSVGSAAELKKRLSENPLAIGYLDASALDRSVKVVVAAQ